MYPKLRRRHLHASVGAATLYGMAVGLWIGLRMGDAGWIETAAFTVFVMIGPAIGGSRIDAHYKYRD